MNQAFEDVRAVIGDALVDELSERAVRDAIWECYFDVEQTVEWAFGKYTLSSKSNLLPIQRYSRTRSKEVSSGAER